MLYLKEEVKEKILSSALMAFKEYGFIGASMRLIAKNAGVSLGNVYRYFKSKEDLFNTIIEPVYRSYIGFIDEIANIIDNEENRNTASQDYYTGMAEINEVKDKVLEICEEHFSELVIFMDKSSGTKYENAKFVLNELLNKILTKKFICLKDNEAELSDEDKIKNDIMYIISASFIESICIILRKCDGGPCTRVLIDRCICLFFKDLEARLADYPTLI
ncbi:MAG TPA: TetR/AcrR family transcriptional regulator [Ruminiclostridium sp.]|nr:TetR/AcrR family transcriptional regulator [Ruminiclostridium sp.]